MPYLAYCAMWPCPQPHASWRKLQKTNYAGVIRCLPEASNRDEFYVRAVWGQQDTHLSGLPSLIQRAFLLLDIKTKEENKLHALL